MSENKCELCGEPMPSSEGMFKFHGYSGNCPKPPLPRENKGQTPLTEASLDGLTDSIVRQSRLIPANAFAKVRDCSRKLETTLAERDKQLAAAKALLDAPTNWPHKCPITQLPFFMEIDGEPTYGGPFDSYTIPTMEIESGQKWHEGELSRRHFDHDRGQWVDDESLSVRVVSEDYLYTTEERAETAEAECWRLKKDAERYRRLFGERIEWPRLNTGGCIGILEVTLAETNPYSDADYSTVDKKFADEKIDSALAADGGEGSST